MEVRDTSGSWKPEASANTYAHIESKLREHNYDMQVLSYKKVQMKEFNICRSGNKFCGKTYRTVIFSSGINAFKIA